MKATAADIRQEIQFAEHRTLIARQRYEDALRYEGRMRLTLELMGREGEAQQ